MLGRIDLVKVLSEASARARRGETAGAFLREIGLRSATVVIDNGKRKTTWHVPELDVDLDHRRTRSSVAGRAKIEIGCGLLGAHVPQPSACQEQGPEPVAVNVQGLVPREPGGRVSPSGGARGLRRAALRRGQAGAVQHRGDSRRQDRDRGRVRATWRCPTSNADSDAHRRRARRAHLRRRRPQASRSAPLRCPGATVTYSSPGPSSAPPRRGRPPLGLRGRVDARGRSAPRRRARCRSTSSRQRAISAPEQGRIVLDRLLVRAGGAELTARGEMADVGGVMRTRLEGKIGAMPAEPAQDPVAGLAGAGDPHLGVEPASRAALSRAARSRCCAAPSRPTAAGRP